MNFKDLYKSANDNISADKKIIDIIYVKADSKSSTFPLEFRQISLCAAAVLLIFALTILPRIYSNPSDVDEHKNVALENDNVSIKIKEKQKISKTIKKTIQEKTDDIIPEFDDIFEEKSNVTDSSEDLNTVKEIQKTEEKVVAEVKETDPVSEDKDTISSDNEVAVANESFERISDSTSVAPSSSSSSDEFFAKSSASGSSLSGKSSASSGGYISSGGGGGSGGGSAYASSNVRVDLSIDDYVDYLGIDMSKINIKLPNGMSFSVPKQVSVLKAAGGNNYVYDDVQFVATDLHNPQKTISVSTTKLGGDAKRILESTASTKKKINNYECVFINDDTLCQAYFKYNDVWVTVLTVNVLNDEFETLIYSMLN